MKYRKGDRVYVEGMGSGTVALDTYNAYNVEKNPKFFTLTPVRFDDYLGQTAALCVETERIELLEQEDPEASAGR